MIDSVRLRPHDAFEIYELCAPGWEQLWRLVTGPILERDSHFSTPTAWRKRRHGRGHILSL